MLKPDAEIAKILGEAGISNDMPLILYDEGSGKNSGRVYWILKYMGASDVKVLNGQMKVWKMKRKPVTDSIPSVKKTTFIPNTDNSILADMSDVKAAIENPNAVIVDVRSPEEYTGIAETELRKGHVPGAVNIEFSEVLNHRSELKTKDEILALFQAKGVSPDKEVILYCETSVRAGIVFLALKSVAGFPDVKVYDGAYLEWQATASNPVE